jgi:hypothetical protein
VRLGCAEPQFRSSIPAASCGAPNTARRLRRWFRSSTGASSRTLLQPTGYHGSLARPPLAINRLGRCIGFAPRFDVDAAFADYAAWLNEFPKLIEGSA